MCGRFVRKCSIDEIKDEFDIGEVAWASEPSYNVAPMQDIAGIINKEGTNRLVKFRWGLVPFWAKDPSIGNRMINARSETLVTKPSFSKIFKNQRCLIVADGFYEWKIENDKKIPLYIHLRSDKPFGLAGLYSTWKDKEGGVLATCTIITTLPNELLMPIHNRMPVIIDPLSRKTWLDNEISEPDQLMPLLKPYNASEMEAYTVSRQMNKPDYNSPDCIKRVEKL